MWQRYANASEILVGNGLPITGGDQVVDLSAADKIAIEFPGGRQRTADVLFCETGRLVIQFELGTRVKLVRVEDETGSFAQFILSERFSRPILAAGLAGVATSRVRTGRNCRAVESEYHRRSVSAEPWVPCPSSTAAQGIE
jgi:hypothetical protein